MSKTGLIGHPDAIFISGISFKAVDRGKKMVFFLLD
jgi:hypothetical protein